MAFLKKLRFPKFSRNKKEVRCTQVLHRSARPSEKKMLCFLRYFRWLARLTTFYCVLVTYSFLSSLKITDCWNKGHWWKIPIWRRWCWKEGRRHSSTLSCNGRPRRRWCGEQHGCVYQRRQDKGKRCRKRSLGRRRHKRDPWSTRIVQDSKIRLGLLRCCVHNALNQTSGGYLMVEKDQHIDIWTRRFHCVCACAAELAWFLVMAYRTSNIHSCIILLKRSLSVSLSFYTPYSVEQSM